MLITKKRVPILIGENASHGWEGLNLEEKWIAIDTETTGLDHRGTRGVDRTKEPARPFFCSLCDPDGSLAWQRWYVDAFTRKVLYPEKAFQTYLREILEDESIAKVFANAPFDKRMLEAAGYSIRGEIHDVLLASHVVRSDMQEYGLKSLCKNLLGMDDEDEKELDDATKDARNKVRSARRRIAAGKATDHDKILAHYAINEGDEDQAFKSDFWLAPHGILERYGCRDALRTASLWIALKNQMDEDAELSGSESSHLWETYRQEQALQPVVMGMEDRGIAVDLDKCRELVSFYQGVRDAAAKGIVAETSEDFNPRSNPQLQVEFFVTRKIEPVQWVTKKRAKEPNRCSHCKGRGCAVCWNTGKQPQCNGDFLAKIGVRRETDLNGEDVLKPADLLAYHILREKAAKAMQDFANSYLELAVKHPDCYAIHPHYRQAEAITLRFSCSKPNLQNVADDDSGKKKIDVPYRPRECFVPRPGFVMIAPDYSQIEVWILFLRSGDKKMGEMLVAGGDLHGRIASNIWSKDFDLDGALADKKRDARSLSKHALVNLKTYVNRRKRSKNIQFCKIYGGGPTKIGTMIGCSTEEAKVFISDWENLFPEIAGYMERKVAEAKATGFSQNIYGYNYPVTRGFEYVAVNYDIQGSAAMLIKRAMVRVGTLATNKWRGKMFPLLTIHDELLIEIENMHNDKLLESAMLDVQNAMQADWKLLKNPVPFPIGMKLIETCWADAKEVKL
jgi:DNA polymerase I-like protein with 3'-5' exonuclease and polymerase domains